jgi:hypothetical protein
MRSILSFILAVLAAAVAIGGSLVYGLSATGFGVITALPATFATCGLLAFIVIVRLRRGFSKVRLIAACFVCGIIVALIPVTVMSFAPLAAVAAVLCMLSILLCYKSKVGFARTYVPAISISVAAALVLLLRLVTTTGVKIVEPPLSPDITVSLPQPDYIDSFQIEPPMHDIPDMLAVFDGFVFSMQPWWPEVPVPHNYDWIDIEPGTKMGLWKVHHRSDHELILGLDRSFIDLRLSLLTDMKGDKPVVIATTVARYNNWRGRVYFTLVRFGHQIVLSDTMRRMAFYLTDEEVEG